MKVTTAALASLAIVTEIALHASASNSPIHQSNHLQKRSLMRRLKGAVGMGEEMEKRETVYSGTATHYGASVSEGACGVYSSYTSNVVALNIEQYGDENAISSHCGQTVVITGGGVTETATIVDCCPTCPGDGDLDMSTGLFQRFGYTLDDGVFPITWYYGSADDTTPTTTDSSSSAVSSAAVVASVSVDAVVAVQSTLTIFSTVVAASTPEVSLAAVSTAVVNVTSSAVSATHTKHANATSTTASTGATATTTGPAQNLAELGQLFAGMLNIANGGVGGS